MHLGRGVEHSIVAGSTYMSRLGSPTPTRSPGDQSKASEFRESRPLQFCHHRVGGADEEGGSPMSGPTSWQCRSTCSKGTDCLAHLKRTWACSPCGALQEGHHCLSLKMARVPINKYTLQ